LLSGRYDCVDRIALNAYFEMRRNPGDIRALWVTASIERKKSMLPAVAEAGRRAARPRVQVLIDRRPRTLGPQVDQNDPGVPEDL
jgi:hypothetical protein